MDDWGFSDVGSFGGEIRTPNIDALARRGVRFSNFHVAGSCSPTRAMLQTGVSSHRAGLGNMPETIPPEHVGKPGYDTVLNHRVATIAERFIWGGALLLRAARRDRAAALGIVPAGTPMAPMPTTTRFQPGDDAAMVAYAAMAEAADHEVGRLVAHLKATGEYDDTIFVFLSDNGPEPTDPRRRLSSRLFLGLSYDFAPEHAGQRGTMTYIGPSWASAAAAPLAGYKFSAAEGGLRVPLIVAWPGNPAIRAGTINGRFTHVTDIVPTLLAAVGVTPDRRGSETITGASLLPALTGSTEPPHRDGRPVGYELSGNAALFKGRYKLVKNLPPLGDGGWRLFDIVADPGETRDLTATAPGRARVMRADYDRYASAEGVLPMPPGYTADDQINANAFRANVAPALRRAAPYFVLALSVLIVGIIWLRRRRRIRVR